MHPLVQLQGILNKSKPSHVDWLMKPMLALLILWTAATQTVSFTDCRCKLACRNKGSCTDCAPESSPVPNAAPTHSCCKPKVPPAEKPVAPKRCVHLEPSSEVTAVAADIPNVVPVEIATVPMVLGQPPAVILQPHVAEVVPRPARSRPIHLLDSVFLI